METAREKYYVVNSMIYLLKTVEGKRTTVELRDEKEVTGTIKWVDGYMNITMENVKFKSAKTGEKQFEKFFVNGKTIRYVHIPDEINMKRAMESKLKQYCSRTQAMRVRQEIQDKAWEKLKKEGSGCTENISEGDERQTGRLIFLTGLNSSLEALESAESACWFDLSEDRNGFRKNYDLV